MLNLSFSVDIGGSGYDSYVVSINRSHSICEGMGTGSIDLAPGASLPDVYDTIVIEELGTKVFTGYVTNIKKGRMDVEYIVEFADPIIKLADYWTDTVYESTGETAQYWIGFFCDLVGVGYQFDVSYNKIVPDNSRDDGIEWQYQSAQDIIRELIVIGGYYMWADESGLIHFSDIEHGANGNSPDILSFRREQSLDPTRNKAIVFGRAPIAATATVTVPELAGREKTAVAASPYVETAAYAQALANKMIAHFSSTADVKYLEIIGIPSLKVGQTLGYSDSWVDISGEGLVVKYSSKMDNSGYTMDVVLDEYCPFIWGYLRLIAITVYAGTDGVGVWRSKNLGVSWEDISGDLPSGAYYVRGISASGATVWTSTAAGVYYTTEGDALIASGITWTDRTPAWPSGTTDWTDIEIDPADVGVVYTLMDDITNSGVHMHKTDDFGLSWSNVEVR